MLVECGSVVRELPPVDAMFTGVPPSTNGRRVIVQHFPRRVLRPRHIERRSARIRFHRLGLHHPGSFVVFCKKTITLEDPVPDTPSILFILLRAFIQSRDLPKGLLKLFLQSHHVVITSSSSDHRIIGMCAVMNSLV